MSSASPFPSSSTDDCFEAIDQTLTKLEASRSQMAPSFVFVDPYGFKLPGQLLRRLLAHRGVELFINVIWRELDMAIKLGLGIEKPTTAKLYKSLWNDDGEQSEPAITKPSDDANRGWEKTLNSVFDGDEWRKIVVPDADERADQCADLFRKVTGARWGTHLRMLDSGRTRYFLLHLTNHDAGRELMKECI